MKNVGLKNALLVSYLVLAITALGCLAAYVFLPPSQEGWRAFFLNLGTEVLGILLVVLLIDAVIRRRDEQERRRYRSVALQQLYRPLENHLRLLFNIYKASVAQKPAKVISRVEDLFDDDYMKQVMHFSLTTPSPGAAGLAIDNRLPWFEYLHSEVQELKDDVERIVDKYAMHLDSESLDLMEQLIHSPFVYAAGHGRSAALTMSQMGFQGHLNFFLTEPDTNTVRKHTRIFCKLVDIYNSEAPYDRKIVVDESLWGSHVAPQIGSARAPYRYTDEEGREHLVE